MKELLVVMLLGICLIGAASSLETSDIRTYTPYDEVGSKSHKVVDYSEIIENITCSVNYTEIDELQLGLVYGSLDKDEFIIFALATVNENRTDFKVEHVMRQWVDSVRYDMSGDTLTLVINVWALFRRLHFGCKVIPTADVPAIHKTFRVPYNGLISVWAWANTSSLTRANETYAIHMSCPGPRVTKLELDRLIRRKSPSKSFDKDQWESYANIEIPPSRNFNGMFPRLSGIGYTSSHPKFEVKLSYEPDGRYQLNVVDETPISESTQRTFRPKCSHGGNSDTSNDGFKVLYGATSWEFDLPIVDRSTDLTPYVVASTSHVWKKGKFQVTCTINTSSGTVNSIVLTASHFYAGNIADTQLPFSDVSSSIAGANSTVVKETNVVIVTVQLQHNTQNRLGTTVTFTCTAQTNKGPMSGSTNVTHQWTERPQHLVQRMPTIHPSISGKARLVMPASVTTADTAVFNCTLEGSGDYEVTWYKMDAASHVFVPFPYGNFTTVNVFNKLFKFVRPSIDDSGVYRCRLSSTRTSATRLSRAVNFTVVDATSATTVSAAADYAAILALLLVGAWLL